MNDPYQVLEVDRSASDDQIKEAYRSLAKKYHPDNYMNTPLASLAEEKMAEINGAFDEIMKERRLAGHTSSAGSNYNSYQTNQGGSNQFQDIRRLLRENRIVEAEELLNTTPSYARDAEWYFLKGSVCFSRGWLDEATEHFKTANKMNPGNQEYADALNRCLWQRGGNFGSQQYGSYRTNNRNTGCSCCDICAGLICLDCLCDCC